MTKQEIFDKVAKHLLTQGVRSVDGANGRCMYRGTNGTKCAAGCLIPDDKYDNRFERKAWSSIADKFPELIEHEHLIQQLQIVHDSCAPEQWITALRNTATIFGLEYKHAEYI